MTANHGVRLLLGLAIGALVAIDRVRRRPAPGDRRLANAGSNALN